MQNFATVSPRQFEVENHQVGTGAARDVDTIDEPDRLLAVVERRNIASYVVLIERFPDEANVGGIVLYDDDPGGAVFRIRTRIVFSRGG